MVILGVRDLTYNFEGGTTESLTSRYYDAHITDE